MSHIAREISENLLQFNSRAYNWYNDSLIDEETFYIFHLVTSRPTLFRIEVLQNCLVALQANNPALFDPTPPPRHPERARNYEARQ